MANLLALSKLGNGLFTLILGIVVVFAGMLIIVLAVSIAGKIMKRNSEKGEKEKALSQFKIAQKVIDAFKDDFIEDKWLNATVYTYALEQRKEIEKLQGAL